MHRTAAHLPPPPTSLTHCLAVAILKPRSVPCTCTCLGPPLSPASPFLEGGNTQYPPGLQGKVVRCAQKAFRLLGMGRNVHSMAYARTLEEQKEVGGGRGQAERLSVHSACTIAWCSTAQHSAAQAQGSFGSARGVP